MPTKVTPLPSVLTKRQKKYIEIRLSGKTKTEAIEMVGVKRHGGVKELKEPIVELTILQRMKEVQGMLLDGITPEKVAEMKVPDIVSSFTALTDKVQVQEGKATQHIAHLHSLSGEATIKHKDDDRIKQILGRRISLPEGTDGRGVDGSTEGPTEEAGDLPQ